MKLNNILSGKVEVVGKPTTFLLEWNEEQQKKVYDALMKIFKNKILTNHRGERSIIHNIDNLNDFFGFPYTSVSSFALISNTNTLYFVDENGMYNLTYVAMDVDENVYIIAKNASEEEVFLKVI